MTKLLLLAAACALLALALTATPRPSQKTPGQKLGSQVADVIKGH